MFSTVEAIAGREEGLLISTLERLFLSFQFKSAGV